MEVLLLVGLFYLFSPSQPPGTNEPHYLCKAKSFWDPTFCPNDVFLQSADAHYLFYFTLGWLTSFLSLPVAAIAGRVICWTAIAIGWRMLSFSIVERPFYSLLSAGLAIVLIQHCHFAGEWLIGGVEAKCIAYAFVFAGISFIVKRNWFPVWILFGIAAAFHVIVGGWAVIAGLFALTFSFGNRGRWLTQLISLFIGFAISLIGLVPALMLTVGQDSEIVKQANEIYTFDRIAHHLVFSHICETQPERFDFFVAAFVFWLVAALLFFDQKKLTRLNAFVLGTVAIAICGIVIDYQTASAQNFELAASLLRYYWFRMADVFVPVGIALSMTVVVRVLFQKAYDVGAVVMSILVSLIVANAIWIAYSQAMDRRCQADQLTLVSANGFPEINEKIYKDWIDVCCWIRASTELDSRFITPRNQSTFKWYAHRSEIVAWKDVPQDAVGMVNWRKRFEHVFKFDSFQYGLATFNAEERLINLGRAYDAGYVVVERRHARNRKRYLEFWIEFIRLNNIKPTELKAPLDKPIYLRQVYPNGDCSKEVIRDSSYLVYQLEVPQPYRKTLNQLEALFEVVQNPSKANEINVSAVESQQPSQ